MMVLLEKIKFKINKFLVTNSKIPELDEKRKLIENYRVNFNPSVFIESGTFFGDTIDHFKNLFEELYSIELSNELADKAIERFKEISKIHIIQGNSSDLLPMVLNKVSGTVLFWLDGHYSSAFFVKDEFIKTAKGETNTPVLKELEIILSSGLRAVILIDDARLFLGKDDYPTIKKIKSIVNKSKTCYTVLVSNDVIQIFPKK